MASRTQGWAGGGGDGQNGSQLAATESPMHNDQIRGGSLFCLSACHVQATAATH